MRGRTAALGLAAVLTMTLTSCGVRSEADRGTDTDRLRSGQTEPGPHPERPDYAEGRELLRRNRR